jgi:Tfp pilus assembly protein PilF
VTARGAFLGAVLLVLAPWSACAADFSELLKRGFEQLQGRQFEEAAGSFAEALKLEPASAPARKGLASARAAEALVHLRAGRVRQSRESLEQAVAAAPENPDYHALLAAALFREGEMRGARREVDEALELAPAAAAARELSGDLYDREGQLNRAVGEWEAAAQAGRLPGLTEKIARGRREMAAEEGMGREAGRFFVILYERDVPRAVIDGMVPLLDDAFNTLHDRLGEYPRDEIKVILYSRLAYREITQAPEWTGGVYDGKIRVPVGGLTTVEEAAALKGILVHEMTHAFLFRMAPRGLPRWFNEGLATTFQGWEPASLRAFFATHPPEGIATLEDVDRTLLGRNGDVMKGYAAARLAIADLEEARGFGAIRRIIDGVGSGRPFEEVFRDEARMALPEFQERWRGGLR